MSINDPDRLNENFSIEHDYPNFYSNQMHMHEKLDFEFNTFIVFCSFNGDALS